MDFGATVSELRKQKGISQTDLANQLGIHKNVLGRYERNEVFPSIEIARKIADILDVSDDVLHGGKRDRGGSRANFGFVLDSFAGLDHGIDQSIQKSVD